MQEHYKNLSLEDIPGEEWRDIKGYEGLYQVSNMGRVKSLIRLKILKPFINNYGYHIVSLCKNKITNNFMVHRLVAKAFIENDDPINKTQVNHKDECKTNNNVNNLEWCNRKYNINYGTRNKRQSEKVKGSGNPMAKKVLCVTTGDIFNCTRDANEYAGLNCDSISSCCRGECYTAGKINGIRLRWRYLNDKDHEPFKEKWEQMEKKFIEKENKKLEKKNLKKRKYIKKK